MPDYYEILQVSPNARAEVIHAAYRVLARDSHPDRNSETDAHARIVLFNTAYGVLSDREKRARYDLQRVRVRRSARGPGVERPPVAVVARQVPPRPSGTTSPQTQRAAIISGPALVVLALVTAVTIVLLAFLWLMVDPESNGIPAAPAITSQMR